MWLQALNCIGSAIWGGSKRDKIAADKERDQLDRQAKLDRLDKLHGQAKELQAKKLKHDKHMQERQQKHEKKLQANQHEHEVDLQARQHEQELRLIEREIEALTIQLRDQDERQFRLRGLEREDSRALDVYPFEGKRGDFGRALDHVPTDRVLVLVAPVRDDGAPEVPGHASASFYARIASTARGLISSRCSQRVFVPFDKPARPFSLPHPDVQEYEIGHRPTLVCSPVVDIQGISVFVSGMNLGKDGQGRVTLPQRILTVPYHLEQVWPAERIACLRSAVTSAGFASTTEAEEMLALGAASLGLALCAMHAVDQHRLSLQPDIEEQLIEVTTADELRLGQDLIETSDANRSRVGSHQLLNRAWAQTRLERADDARRDLLHGLALAIEPHAKDLNPIVSRLPRLVGHRSLSSKLLHKAIRVAERFPDQNELLISLTNALQTPNAGRIGFPVISPNQDNI